ncbi:MAG TPA: transporter, partial [Candidatus Syntrophosphaera sp.]|nr:transporter [Candidatus Syntrophosphaera sp.]
MIQYFKIAGQRFTPALAHDEAFWIHLENPTPEESKALIERFDLPEDFISDLQDADENSRMEYD